MEQPNWEPSIARFLDFVDDKHCALEIVAPEDPESYTQATTQPFKPLDQIREYFRDQNFAELRAILAELFPTDHINHTDIFPNYTAVFCILLCIGQGRYIKQFKRHSSLSDIHLPFVDPKNPPAHAPLTPGLPNFWHDFHKAQWKFCARVWEDLSDKHFESEQILPIVFKKRLEGGGSANIWLVKIHPSYNKLTVDDANELGENANTFVLKEYSTADARKYYENETAAFNKVGSKDSIVKYYGSFVRGNTYNLLLEYADKGTLRRVFEEEEPPTSSEYIIRFWEGILKLINALSCIHAVEPSAPGGPQIFQGWHQDVKPENILVISNGKENPHEWQYKLADLGLSHFKRNTSSRGDSTATDTYGTRTYGAPECSREDPVTEKSKLRVRQNVDIWSLGCVYSEVIRWLVQGHLGVDRYRQERKSEIKLKQAVGVDCFHDGVSALDAVWRSHKVSLDELRKTDFITTSVVYMVNDMLVAAEDRPSAHGPQGLWRKQRRCLEQAEQSLADHNRSTLSPDLVGTSGTTQSRSHTHPALRSSPILPPTLPPDLSPDLMSKLKLQARNRAQDDPAEILRDLGHRNNNSSFFLEDERDYRLSPEPIVDYTNGNTSLHQPKTSPITSHYASPPAPPSTQPPFFISNTSQLQTREVSGLPEHDPWNEDGRPLSIGTRGSLHQADSSSHYYVAANPGLASMSGSLGHNYFGYHQANNANGNPGYRGSTSTFDQQQNLLAGDFRTWQNPANGINQQYRNKSSQSASPPITSGSPLTGFNQHQGLVSLMPQPPRSEIMKPRSVHEIATSDILSIAEALDWKRRCKSMKVNAAGINKRLLSHLYGRDHVFLIDDSDTMAGHWDNMVNVFEALSYIVKKTDKNGLDLCFTHSEEFAENTKETSNLIHLVRSQQNFRKGAKNDINFRLTKILQSRTEKLNKTNIFGKKAKPLSLYILTDGMCLLDYEGAAQEPIKNAVQMLSDVRKGREQIGIQFISFGSNLDALQRLKYLDHGLGLHKDIVDTEPSDGNVWKMLLGPISNLYDGDAPMSPVTIPPEDMAGQSHFLGNRSPR